MTLSGGNGDMRWMRALTDRDIEEVLSGHPPTDRSLVEVAELFSELKVEALRDVALRNPEERVAASAAAVVVRPRLPQRRPRPGLRRKLIAPALGALFLLGGGVAWAVHGSEPGSTLHGVDLALEKVGIGAGGAPERLEEAAVLAGSGSVAQGLDHAAQALADSQPEGAGEAAAAALADAAQRIREGAAAAPEGVADLLGYLASVIGEEGVEGEMVSAIAQSIKDSVSHPETQAGPPEEAPAGPPSDVPPGPPEDLPVDQPGQGPPVSVPAAP